MRFGPKQLEIMDVLWSHGRCSAKQITDHLLAAGKEVAHSTVQTQLRLLARKGAVDHETQDRTFVFFPLVQRQDTARQATRDVLGRLFGGSAAAMVSHLLDENELNAKELDEIRRLIDAHDSDSTPS